MLAEQRFEAILRELSDNRAASVSRLCQLTGASEATIRRDLNILSRQGKLSKVHGGAVLSGGAFQGEEPDVGTKALLHQDEKERIAHYAAGLIDDDDVVYLDAGTTTVRMVEYLKGSGATFVTNGVACAQRLMELGLRGYVLGGFLKPGTWAVVGTGALEELGKYNFTKAFLGINGITIRQGFTTPDPEEAAIKTKAAEQAYLTFVLADSSKFELVSAVTVLPLEKATIITEHLPDPGYLEHTVIKEVSE
ncbi:DeoR/GlpR family DNA-binding transcription regulator [uncultured Flavonifractor sp.]|uniref:DeoR/GlpR family DNA-binding transcription regulator n=1 Tax=uncultured Flavonifractor sp. TaxID=1193534 RepID=UPI0026069836|nr:DeoR/GlpR family DNA-binding transcription regulator [uncultured Flavonifractor sp.]